VSEAMQISNKLTSKSSNFPYLCFDSKIEFSLITIYSIYACVSFDI